MRESVDAVEAQLAFVAQVPVVALGVEHGALGHAARVDVQADGYRILTRIADGVVLVRGIRLPAEPGPAWIEPTGRKW